MNIYRRIDELGRVVLPMDFRKTLQWQPYDYLLMQCDEETQSVILTTVDEQTKLELQNECAENDRNLFLSLSLRDQKRIKKMQQKARQIYEKQMKTAKEVERPE